MSPGEEGAGFDDRLSATLVLSTGGKSFTITAGDLKSFSLDIEPFGFSASASFWFVAVAAQSEDELFASFIEKDLIEVSLTLSRAFDQVAEAAKPMTVKGLVTEKRVQERAFPDVSGTPVLQRRYSIRFEDRAGVLFRQHQPTAIYVDKSYKDLFVANKPTGVNLEFAWPAAEKKRPVLSLALGAEEDDEASFRDFVFFLLHRENAGLYYDLAKDKYQLSAKKPAAGKATKLLTGEVASLQAYFPAPRRSSDSVLNASTQVTQRKKDIKNDKGVAGVRRDHLIRSPVQSHLDARVTLETARSKPADAEAWVELSVFPTTPLVPSMKVELEAGFGASVFQAKKTYRVLTTSLSAEARSQEATDDNGESTNGYHLRYALRLELLSDPAFRYPPFRRPRWPFHVEGKVVSEIGEAKQGTYQVYQEAETSAEVYRVKVPLFADQKVIAPYEPYYQSGHFYFPAYKDQRVLLEVDFDRARIRAFLDFRPGARLPLDSQGNHILMGKGKKDETSVRHVYEDNKPKLVIERSKENDHQLITVSEGTIRFETHETKGS